MKIKFYYVIAGKRVMYGPASRRNCDDYIRDLCKKARLPLPPDIRIYFEEKELTLFED